MTNSTQVKEFYNEFTDTRMLQYKIHGNPRIDKAVKLITDNLNPNSYILDLGCGIGIVPEQVSLKLDRGKILACDLSDNNIQYAQKTVKSDKVEFLNVNIVENFEVVSNKLSAPVDLITLVDVIEHLPADSYDELFSNFGRVTNDNAKLVLTYPSPEYQVYLQQNDPDELQIIDEVIEISSLMQFASKYGFKLEYFTYVDVWRKNQYIHCVFSKQRPCVLVPEGGVRQKMQYKLKRLRSKLIAPFLKGKY